jgi:hypothetical protein
VSGGAITRYGYIQGGSTGIGIHSEASTNVNIGASNNIILTGSNIYLNGITQFGTYTVNMPYYSGDYGTTWSTSLPSPSGTANGGEMVVYNSHSGITSSRLYIYSNGGWHYIVII